METKQSRPGEQPPGTGPVIGSDANHSTSHPTSPYHYAQKHEEALRAYEAVHQEWMETSIFDEKKFLNCKERLRLASIEYERWMRAHEAERQSPFEVLGFIEEIFEQVGDKEVMLGSCPVEAPDRPFGHDGRRLFSIYSPFRLTKNGKEVIVKATSNRPKDLYGELQIICGRAKFDMACDRLKDEVRLGCDPLGTGKRIIRQMGLPEDTIGAMLAVIFACKER